MPLKTGFELNSSLYPASKSSCEWVMPVYHQWAWALVHHDDLFESQGNSIRKLLFTPFDIALHSPFANTLFCLPAKQPIIQAKSITHPNPVAIEHASALAAGPSWLSSAALAESIIHHGFHQNPWSFGLLHPSALAAYWLPSQSVLSIPPSSSNFAHQSNCASIDIRCFPNFSNRPKHALQAC